MYHIKLIKGMSYYGAVTATRKHPDVFTEDEEKYTSAMKSGYFADLTVSDRTEDLGDEKSGEEASMVPGNEEPDTKDHLSDMSVDELKAYAELNGISLAGAKKKADIISAIREAEAKAAEARSVLRGEQ